MQAIDALEVDEYTLTVLKNAHGQRLVCIIVKGSDGSDHLIPLHSSWDVDEFIGVLVDMKKKAWPKWDITA